MKIAFVHSTYASSSASGENTVVRNEVDALRRAGHEVLLVHRDTDVLSEERLYPIHAGLRTATGRGGSPLPDLERFGPDVVHVHNTFPNMGTRWAARCVFPIVHTVHNYRYQCSNGIMFRDGHRCTDCRDRTPFEAIRHACYRGSRVQTLPLAIGISNGSGNALLESARRVVALSEPGREFLTGLGVPSERIVIWPNFIPGEFAPPPRDAPASWLSVGRVTVEKGVPHLVAAWPDDVPLTVVGDGPALAEAQSLAAGKLVRFTGRAAPEEVILEMRRSIGLIIASRCDEQFPMVYPEALSQGLGVIAMESNVVASLVARDGTGIAVRWKDRFTPEDLMQWASAMRSVGTTPADVFSSKYSERAYLRRAEALYGALSQ